MDERGGLLEGVGDIRVWGEGAENLEEVILNAIKVDTRSIHKVKVLTDKVDVSEPGSYEITFIVLAHRDSLDRYLENPSDYKKNMAPPDMCFSDDIADGVIRDTYILGTFDCEVMDTSAAAAAYENGETGILGAIDRDGNPGGRFQEAYTGL